MSTKKAHALAAALRLNGLAGPGRASAVLCWYRGGGVRMG